MTKHVWRKCLECDDFAVEFNFYNPDAVYCEGCNQQVGTTDRPVETDILAFVGDEVVHPTTGETLATVEYDDERVATYDSVTIGSDAEGKTVFRGNE